MARRWTAVGCASRDAIHHVPAPIASTAAAAAAMRSIPLGQSAGASGPRGSRGREREGAAVVIATGGGRREGGRHGRRRRRRQGARPRTAPGATTRPAPRCSMAPAPVASAPCGSRRWARRRTALRAATGAGGGRGAVASGAMRDGACGGGARTQRGAARREPAVGAGARVRRRRDAAGPGDGRGADGSSLVGGPASGSIGRRDRRRGLRRLGRIADLVGHVDRKLLARRLGAAQRPPRSRGLRRARAPLSALRGLAEGRAYPRGHPHRQQEASAHRSGAAPPPSPRPTGSASPDPPRAPASPRPRAAPPTGLAWGRVTGGTRPLSSWVTMAEGCKLGKKRRWLIASQSMTPTL